MGTISASKQNTLAGVKKVCAHVQNISLFYQSEVSQKHTRLFLDGSLYLKNCDPLSFFLCSKAEL